MNMFPHSIPFQKTKQNSKHTMNKTGDLFDRELKS